MSEIATSPESFRRGDLIVQRGRTLIYRAIHIDEGTEVLWHELSYDDPAPPGFKTLCADLQALGAMDQHPNILFLHYSWLDEDRHIIFYITESPPESIRHYMSEVLTRNPSKPPIVRWSSQVITGLQRLHAQSVPIIHRDLHCDNIFIDRSEGTVKIGLPGLEMALNERHSPTGAPELPGLVTPASDVWLFGLALLEMATREVPYAEFEVESAKRAAIFARHMPRALSDVEDAEVADLVVNCLFPVASRPSAARVMEHELFADSGIERSLSAERFDIGVPPQRAVPDLRDSPEFADLVRRQKAERDELIAKQKAEVDAYRGQHRQRSRAPSIRELLNENLD
jgi:WNK lysine deficient protein kinase